MTYDELLDKYAIARAEVLALRQSEYAHVMRAQELQGKLNVAENRAAKIEERVKELEDMISGDE
jgi:hypothetical protein